MKFIGSIETSKLLRESFYSWDNLCSNLDGQVEEFTEKVREDQTKKMSPQKYVKNTNNDPYDFWRTSVNYRGSA